MLKAQIVVGDYYKMKVSGNVVTVQITSESPHGGWNGKNTVTGREVRIKTAGKLRGKTVRPT